MPIDLKKKLENIDRRLRIDLEDIRASFQHSGNKGAGFESVFREYVRTHLPRAFDVGHGEVADSYGRVAGSTERDGQIDIVIVDHTHPATLRSDGPTTFFIEGVMAAGEVKMALSQSDILDVLEKSRAFKSLWAPLKGDTVASWPSGLKRFVERRAYFLFAGGGSVNEIKMKRAIEAYVKANDLADENYIDAIFILDQGAYINIGDGKGGLAITDSQGNLLTGWCRMEGGVMLNLIMWLDIVLPRIMGRRSYLYRYLRAMSDSK